MSSEFSLTATRWPVTIDPPQRERSEVTDVIGRPEFHRLRSETAVEFAKLCERHSQEPHELRIDYYDRLLAAGCDDDELGIEWIALVQQAIPLDRDFDGQAA